ncbi:hypothetical protein ABTL45_19915, partial [Acinetobacter baumannii]
TPVAINDPFSVGVRLGFLLEFFEKEQTADADATTTDMCNDVVKPMTTSFRCSLAEYWTAVSPQAIGKPCAFISHAWKYKF